MLCCRARGNFPNVERESLKQLVSDYIAAEIVDRPIPTEIIETLRDAKHRARFDTEPNLVAAEICRLIEGIGDQNVFPEELDEFRATSGNAE